MPNVESSFYYDMSGQKFLCIFNHERYQKTADFEAIGFGHPSRRIGTEHDVKNLTNTFSDLGYKVAIYNDLRYAEIISKLAAFCQSDHSETSCVAVAILTHGRDSNQLMAADKPYRLTEICNILHNGNLAGKPKILFVQACRHGHEVDKNNVYFPTPPDFLIMNATVADYVSFRTTNEGSFMINAICDVLKELTEKTIYNETTKRLSYAEFVTMVNNKVASVTTKSDDPILDKKKQIPETKITLMKSFVFWPNNRG